MKIVLCMGTVYVPIGDLFMYPWGPVYVPMGTCLCTHGDLFMYPWGPVYVPMGTCLCTHGDLFMYPWGPVWKCELWTPVYLRMYYFLFASTGVVVYI